MAEKTDLTRGQVKALAALVSQPTLTLAAKQARVSERTMYRWLSDNEPFRTEYRRLQREVVSNATYQLMKASNNAVNALTSVMSDPEAPASSRVQAAKTVLETEDLEERLSNLEERPARPVSSRER